MVMNIIKLTLALPLGSVSCLAKEHADLAKALQDRVHSIGSLLCSQHDKNVRCKVHKIYVNATLFASVFAPSCTVLIGHTTA